MRGLVDDGDEPERDRQREHHPHLHDIGEHDEPQRDREDRGHRLRDEQHRAPVVAVDDGAAPQAEQQHRQEAERERGADGGAAVGQRQDEPGLGHVLHPRPGVRDELAREEQPVVVRVERAEGASDRSAYRGHGWTEGTGRPSPAPVDWIVFGLCILLFAWSLRVLRPAALALVVVVALSGVGTLTAGTFSCDKGCPAKGVTSTHQDLHNGSSIVTFSAWIIAPFVAARQLRGSRFARAWLLLGGVELAFGIALGSMSDHQPDDPVGLLQRVVLVAVGVWFTLLALELRSTSD